MTFDQIKYFVSVMEHETFFEAAEELHMTQSALSKQIIRLEKELGVKLLDRSKRRASATEAGRIFYRDCLQLLEMYNVSLKHMAPFYSPAKYQLSIGTLPILTQHHLTSAFRTFQKEHTDIRILLDEVEEPQLKEGMQKGAYDLVIARKNMCFEKESILYDLADDTLCAVLPDNPELCRLMGLHPSICHAVFEGKNDALALSSLSDVPFILMNRYTSVYRKCMESFEKEGLHANVLRTARVESIISAVAVGEGASLLPASNFRIFHHEHIRILPLSPSIHLPVVLCCRKNALKQPPVKSFIEFFQSNKKLAYSENK